jgi:hypothetical protein
MSTVQTASPPFVVHSTSVGSVTTRFLDFWLLGGASICVWAVLFFADGFRDSWPVGRHFGNIPAIAFSLALLVNYPHFMLSYKLAYTRGGHFIRTHWWQLIAVPVLLLVWLAASYVYYERPALQVPIIFGAGRVLREFGVNAQVVSGPRVGDVLLTLAFNFMAVTIGWHYTKQVFGCMMVYAHHDRYPLTPIHRTVVKWALFTVWVLTIVDNNIDGVFRQWAGFNYSSFDLPNVAAPLSAAIVAAGAAAIGYLVVARNHRLTGRWPSVNMVVPLLALYVWWLPITRQAEFYLLLTPFFHSLQYLGFVYRVESHRLHAARYRDLRATVIILGAVVAGWVIFELGPAIADERLATVRRWDFFFFVVAATLFVNIHHYFIDNVIWRLSDPVVRAGLIGVADPAAEAPANAVR